MTRSSILEKYGRRKIGLLISSDLYAAVTLFSPGDISLP